MPPPSDTLAAHPEASAQAASLPRSEQAYARLRDLIHRNQLRPGARLREQELAASLGLSRTPVRAALARLEAEGLVANDPIKGVVVTELDPDMVDELYAMREVLESTAARLAATHASAVEIAVLREIAERDRVLAGDGDALRLNNRRFHMHLYRCAHNRYLLKTVSAMQEAVMLLGRSTLGEISRADAAYQEHLDVVAALERRDPAAAEQAMQAHIRLAYRARLQLMVAEEDRRDGAAQPPATPRSPRATPGAAHHSNHLASPSDPARTPADVP